MFRELLGKTVVSGARFASVVSLVFYVLGIVLLVLMFLKLTSLELTVEGLFLGTVAVVTLAMQIMIIGFLIDIRGRILSRDEAEK